MRRFALTAAVLVLSAAPALSQSALRIDMGNTVNVLELDQYQARNELYLRQTGQRNIARVRQSGTVNSAEIHQTGRANSASLWQSGSGANTAAINQYATVAQAEGRTSRVTRSMVVDGSDSSYLSAYQNAGVSILQITRDPQPYGRLGRR